MMLTPSLKGRASTSTLESWRTNWLNSLMASAISSFTPAEQYVRPCMTASGITDASNCSPWSKPKQSLQPVVYLRSTFMHAKRGRCAVPS